MENEDNNHWDELETINKVGLTFGIGYRIYGYNGWYWGTSLFAGSYFNKDDYLFEDYFGSTKMIWDFELLKIGRTF